MATQPVRLRFDQGLNLSDDRSELKPGELSIARNCMYGPDSPILRKVKGKTHLGDVGAKISGLSFVRFSDGSAFLLAAAGFSYYSKPLNGGTWTAQKTFTDTEVGKMEAIYFNGANRVYVSDGRHRMQVWDGSSSMRDAGLDTPTNGVGEILSNAGTSYISGSTFQYCHTEYDPDVDEESAPTEPVALSSAAANDTFKYQVPTVTNSGKSNLKIRIYRTANGGNIFYRIAEFAAADFDLFYDGTNTDSSTPVTAGFGFNDPILGVYTTGTEWGFSSVEDSFLQSQPTTDMVGEPLKGNYVQANGTPPVGNIIAFFKNKQVVAGVGDYTQDVYYSQPDWPTQFTATDYVREENGLGDPVSALGVANDLFIAMTKNTMWRHNLLPSPSRDPVFILGEATREEIEETEGCMGSRLVCNYGSGRSFLFFVSTAGPTATDSYNNVPLYQDLEWSKKYIRIPGVPDGVAVNFKKLNQIWLFLQSPQAKSNDIAFIYHYHPQHRKESTGVGKWTGPISVRAQDACVAFEDNQESRLFVADTDDAGGVYELDSGLVDEQNCDADDGSILWEWATGDDFMGMESMLKKVHRVFLSMPGSQDNFTPTLSVAVNKGQREKNVPLSLRTKGSPDLIPWGDSLVEQRRSRTWRGLPFKTASHFRWHMKELAIGDRELSAFEIETQLMSRQK